MSSHNEKSFIRDVTRAAKNHEKLLSKGQFSVEPHVGALAIHVSTAVDLSSSLSGDAQVKVFREEAERVQEEYERLRIYGGVVLHQCAERYELAMSLRDKEVAGVVTIGHGSIGCLRLPQGQVFDWRDVAGTSSDRLIGRGHLKTGEIVQRTCGHVPVKGKGRTAPWGTFALRDQRNLFAALGKPIPDAYPDESSFVRVFDKPTNSPEDIIALMQQHRGNNKSFGANDQYIG